MSGRFRPERCPERNTPAQAELGRGTLERPVHLSHNFLHPCYI